MSSTHPYYRRKRPAPKARALGSNGRFMNFADPSTRLSAFGTDRVNHSRQSFDDRAAEVMRSAVGPRELDTWWPGQDIFNLVGGGLMEHHGYPESGTGPVNHPTMRCLAILAYPDYFFPSGVAARSAVNESIMLSNPGWCGTFGPVAEGAIDFLLGNVDEGNYDMAQMHLLPMAYAYYDELGANEREVLITSLLAGGTIHGPGQNDSHTRGPYPPTWSRAGFISPGGIEKRIGETENHILMTMTVRYLTNQLLYQRTPHPSYDNRRNYDAGDGDIGGVIGSVAQSVGFNSPSAPGSCTHLILDLLQRILRDDFSEYNAKNYQRETRNALLNLCSYAYDHEVRLAAQMVLDYLSAHYAVSSNDLRRLLPFRRLNHENKSARLAGGFMGCGILEWQDGSDSMPQTFAILTGQMRSWQSLASAPGRGATVWEIRDFGGDQVLDVVADYRLPDPILDLFVTDGHRRFFQRLHRTWRDDEQEVGGNRNTDTMEIFAGSPSYLITAGGAPAGYAIDPYFLGVPRGSPEKQLGVAVTTSFIPTSRLDPLTKAEDLIQFSYFSQSAGLAENYGVAPDFACGHQIHLPSWVTQLRLTARWVSDGNFTFIDQGPGVGAVRTSEPGFYLAIYQESSFALMEAYDTWVHPEMSFEAFRADVKRRNPNVSIINNQINFYTTANGNQLEFRVGLAVTSFGVEGVVGGLTYTTARVTKVVYGDGDPQDAAGDAGNRLDPFLSGTVMNSPRDATIEITNRYLGQGGQTITLDMGDMLHPRRIAETGEVEQAGFGSEVWLDFDWRGNSQGDAFQPVKTMAAATAVVAAGGTIRIVPGRTRERGPLGVGGKRMKLFAPIGGVTLGARPRDVWVDFGWGSSSDGTQARPFRQLAPAIAEVTNDGRVNLAPGHTITRQTIGGGKRFTLVAPHGGVRLGGA